MVQIKAACLACGLMLFGGHPERPLVDVPVTWRQANYGQGGSCVHASVITALRVCGAFNEASRWRGCHSGGENIDSLVQLLESEKVHYDYCIGFNADFLERAMRHGMPVCVSYDYKAHKVWCPYHRTYHFYRVGHMTTLVHFDKEWACILDNNDPENYHWHPRAVVEQWFRDAGQSHMAVVIAYPPLPPRVHE